MISEDGENGTLEAVFKGTHTGPLNAPSGTIPATGKAVEVPFRYNHEGKRRKVH